MKMKGQIDSVYPPAKESKKKGKKASKKTAQDKQKGKTKSKKKKSADIVTPTTVLEQVESVIAPVKEATQAVKETLEETIQALEKSHTPVTDDSPAVLDETDDGKTKNPIARASKNSQPLVDDDKQKTMQRIIKQLIMGDISQGEALKILRIQVLGLKQEDFATLVGVSRKTLSENENDKGNYTADIVNKLFQPFDLKVGLLPNSVKTLERLLVSKNS
ncbi:Helix-turn-helix domain protein [Marinomonas spartinae]|uniref:Helix-turn-helix domain protein n=1 Tax=Marinomonas spartinae TaxID=1792290 RepID=A0A1A8T4D0_9GAMM|nr:helix-turn-helix transcriptional regulator [Marinomonas spartinae]SBS26340.1 Helix-turn-helix domain protein [Marinomonas spartinae]